MADISEANKSSEVQSVLSEVKSKFSFIHFKAEDEVWARLNTLSKKAKSAEIKTEIFSVGRLPNNDL